LRKAEERWLLTVLSARYPFPCLVDG
jgi:hypothetical protein